jgi:DNA-3-methyladenine glycosylase
MATRLTQKFYSQDTISVARGLLGQRLVHQPPAGPQLSGRIVETEAYLGSEDQAAHSYGGRRTERTEVMFGPPGFSYVYFIYGMYNCLNVVTERQGVPEAVLIRALALDGNDQVLANGPGKLCRALGLDRRHNALDLTRDPNLWIEHAPKLAEHEIVEGPRVGLGDRYDAVHWPLRFGWKNHPALSLPRFPAE